MFCKYCGANMPDSTKFCGKCGKPMSTVAPAPQPAVGSVPNASIPQGQPVAVGTAGTAAPSVSLSKFFATPAAKYVAIGAGVIVLIVAAVLVFNLFSSKACTSSQQVAEKTQTVLQQTIDAGISGGSVEPALEGAIALFPPEALEQKGLSKSELLTAFENERGLTFSTQLESMQKLQDTMRMTLSVRPGSPLSSSDLVDINESLSEAGVTSKATAAQELDCDCTLTLLKDYEGSAAGETATSKVSFDYCAVQIDGKWYLWPEA